MNIGTTCYGAGKFQFKAKTQKVGTFLKQSDCTCIQLLWPGEHDTHSSRHSSGIYIFPKVQFNMITLTYHDDLVDTFQKHFSFVDYKDKHMHTHVMSEHLEQHQKTLVSMATSSRDTLSICSV